MTYPHRLIKGLLNYTYLDESDHSIVLPSTFNFDEKYTREDDWIEQSINWEDDQEAINFTLNQKKDGSILFPAGLAVVPTKEIVNLRKTSHLRNRFSYERKESDENKYHGNLVLNKETPKILRKMLRDVIAIKAERIPQDS